MTQLISDTDFVPGDYTKAEAAVASAPSANAPLRLLITGYKMAGGSMAVNTISGPVLSDDQAADLADTGSELARAFRSGRRAGKDLDQIYFGCIEEPSGVPAYAKATISGTWTKGGELRFWVDGDLLRVTVGSTDSAANVATTADEQADRYPGLSYTIGVSSAEITFTLNQSGLRGNKSILYCDRTDAPAGLVVALGGDVGGTVVSDVGPWILANGDTFVVAFNAGGDQTLTITATAAIKTGSGATYAAVTAAHVLNLTLPDPITQVATSRQVVFAGTENTQALYHAAIQAMINGLGIVTNAGGQTRITSVLLGSAAVATVDASSADVLASLGLTASAFTNAGPNNVANLNGTGVTAAEVVAMAVALPLTNGSAADDSGALRFTSTTTGGTGSVQIKSASTADDELGFDNSVHVGGVGAGAAVTGDEATGDGVQFTGGTGTEDVAGLVAAIESDPLWYKMIVVASTDVDNLDLWETMVDETGAPTVQRPASLIVAHVGSQSAATAIAKTQLNHEAFELLWARDAQTPAVEIAACHAVQRALIEREDIKGWNVSYAGAILAGVKLARDKSKHAADHSTQKAALQNGLSPLTSTAAGEAMIVRNIWTRCQNADGSDNYLGLDTAEWTVLQGVREMARNVAAFYRTRNPHVRADFGKEPSISGAATPQGFRQYLFSQIGQALVFALVFAELPAIRSTYNRTQKRIDYEVEFTRAALNLQTTGIIRSLG